MKKALLLTALLLVATTLGTLWRTMSQRPDDSGQSISPEEIEAQLIEGFNFTAEQVNTKAPIKIDDQTRLDGATVGPGARITYRYTLTGLTSAEMDSELFSTHLLPGVVQNACNNGQLRPSIKYGGVYVYEYYGKDDIQIGSLEINRTVCGLR